MQDSAQHLPDAGKGRGGKARAWLRRRIEHARRTRLRDRENEAALYFEGRVNGDVIEGRVRRGTGKAQTVHSWRAVRASAR